MGCCFKFCCCCINMDRRRERMAKLKKLVIAEKEELEQRMSDVYEKSHVEFTGTEEERPDGVDDDHPDYNPYGQLGFGYEAYFSSMQIFAVVFAIMTLMFIPAYSFYHKPGGLASASHGKFNTFVMLGNMGFNKAVCVSDYVQLNSRRELGCEIGTIQELDYAGIIPDTADRNNANMPYGYCGNPNVTSDSSNTETYIPNVEYCSTNYLKY